MSLSLFFFSFLFSTQKKSLDKRVISYLMSFVDVMEDLYNYVNPRNERHSPMISKETLDLVVANKDVRHSFVT